MPVRFMSITFVFGLFFRPSMSVLGSNQLSNSGTPALLIAISILPYFFHATSKRFRTES